MSLRMHITSVTEWAILLSLSYRSVFRNRGNPHTGGEMWTDCSSEERLCVSQKVFAGTTCHFQHTEILVFWKISLWETQILQKFSIRHVSCSVSWFIL